ncbi:hypothetical protein [Chitinophaga caseinilytica]|uniref:Uncharacterized protein n=1 Tax=Chitinophaga caseinilytica TaxID=2267521 RepID=A0ABZ2Z3T2_9BACT
MKKLIYPFLLAITCVGASSLLLSFTEADESGGGGTEDCLTAIVFKCGYTGIDAVRCDFNGVWTGKLACQAVDCDMVTVTRHHCYPATKTHD